MRLARCVSPLYFKLNPVGQGHSWMGDHLGIVQCRFQKKTRNSCEQNCCTVVGLSRTSRVFLRVLRFSSVRKINTQTQAAIRGQLSYGGCRRRLQYAFRLDHVDLRPSLFSRWLQVRMISPLTFILHVIIYMYIRVRAPSSYERTRGSLVLRLHTAINRADFVFWRM